MKKTLLGLMVLALLTISHARAADSSSGCGLGWMILKKNSLVSSFSRALTNYTFSSTLGMTSGTSGCTQHSIVKVDKKPMHYTESNHHALMAEMAAGKGEALETYAAVLGCSPQVRAKFSKTMQNSYGKIYDNVDINPMDVLKNVRAQIANDPVLSKNCTTTYAL